MAKKKQYSEFADGVLDLGDLKICRWDGTWKVDNKSKRGSKIGSFRDYIQSVIAPPKAIAANIETIRSLRSLTLQGAIHKVSKYHLGKRLRLCNTTDKVYALAKFKMAVHIYPSCTFDGDGCRNENIASVSGLLVYDIQEISKETITKLKKWPQTVALHRSIGGGETDFALFLYCRGLSKETYTAAWERGRDLLNTEFGIAATDTDETKDVTRVRFLSMDPDCYVNYAAEPILMDRLIVMTDGLDDATARRIDETLNAEPDWYRFGLSLAITKGEDGRALFHKISAYNKKKYDEATCNEKYDRLLSIPATKGKGITAGTLYWYLDKMGIPFVYPKEAGTKQIVDGEPKEISLGDIIDDIKASWRINEITDEAINTVSGKADSVEDIWIQLSLLHGTTIKIQDVTNILRSRVIPRFNPLIEFFNEKPWDGKDYIAQYCACIPAEDPAQAKLFLTAWLVNTYRQATEENFTNRYLLAYKGTENTGKSKAIEWLCPLDSLLKVGPIETDNKDTRLSMAQYMIWNDDELRATKYSEMNKIKAIISQSIITDRSPYAAKQTRMRRICSFAGSTNDSQILNSTEGNTRFLIISLQNDVKFKWDKYMKINRQQFWAQVKTLAESNYKIDLKEEQKRANESATVITMAEELLDQYFKPSPPDRKRLGMKLFEIMEFMYRILPGGRSELFQAQVRSLVIAKYGKRDKYYSALGERFNGYPCQLTDAAHEILLDLQEQAAKQDPKFREYINSQK